MIRVESGIWDSRKLFDQPLIVARQFCGNQIWPFAHGAVQPLRPAPPLDSGMVAATQHVRDVPATELRRPSELRFLEQTGLPEAFGHGADGIAHGAVEEPSDRFDDQAGADLSPTERSRVTASMTRQAPTSPPLSTTSPMLTSPSHRC